MSRQRWLKKNKSCCGSEGSSCCGDRNRSSGAGTGIGSGVDDVMEGSGEVCKALRYLIGIRKQDRRKKLSKLSQSTLW